jgi:hypothetical protein
VPPSSSPSRNGRASSESSSSECDPSADHVDGSKQRHRRQRRQKRLEDGVAAEKNNWTSILLSQTTDYACEKEPGGKKQRSSLEVNPLA